MMIAITLITCNKQAVSEEHVWDFVEVLERGLRVPPITVRRISSTEFRLVDGRHRLEARRRLGQETVDATVTL